MKTLRIGYIPLADAASLIAAAEQGFAEEEGLALELVREVSWANIRDKLIVGMFDATHMLAPFAIATSLGLGHVRVPLVVPFVLNFNGNAITLSSALYAKVAERLGRHSTDPLEISTTLSEIARQNRIEGGKPLTFAIVFPFSTHTYLVRHWLRLGGCDLENDVQLVVIPPPLMADSLNSGLLDGFCVGNPWNSRAVELGVGHIAAFGADIALHGPDKILALPERFAKSDPESLAKLIRALARAAHWCEQEENHERLAQILAAPNRLDVPVQLLRDTLAGSLQVGGGIRRSDKDFFILGRPGTNRPDPRHAVWLYAEMVHAGQTAFSAATAAQAAAVYRPDLYDGAMGETSAVLPGDPVGLRYGPAFDASAPETYLAELANAPC
jgi:NitT/TauT family transport system ATP-binding protein